MAGEKRVKWTMSAEQNVTQTLEQIMSKVSMTDSLFSKLGGAMSGILAGLSVGALLASMKSVIDAGDQAYKTAQKVGMGVEAWQKFEYAAKLADVSSESLAKGIKNLGDLTLKAKDGGNEAQDTFKRLGISWLDSAGKVKSTDALMLDMADRFSKMPDGIEKTAMATKVFGKAGMELIPFLNQGRDGIQELMAEAEKLGIVMDAKTAAAAEALNDNLTRLQASSRGMLMQGIAPLIPFLSSMSDEFVKAKKEGEGASRMSQALTTGLRLIASAALTVKTLFENIGNSIGGIAAAAVAFFGGEFARAGEILKQTKADNQANLEKLGQGLSNVWDGVAVGAEHAKTGIRGVGDPR
jgi:hypothetical protein